MRSALSLLVLLLGAPLVWGCGQAPELDKLAAGESGKVREVVSGHYLVLEDGLEVRLVGLIAPKYEEPHAAQSREALRRLADGQTVRLYYGGQKRDVYGRALAQVKVAKGGAWLQRELLKAGAARVRMYPDNRALAGPMLEAEATARNAGKGLWADRIYRVKSPREAASAYDFVIVEGRPRAAGDGRLDFGDGLEAWIPDKARRDFEDAGKAPAKLAGQLIRIRGVVGGGELRLDMPEQVELLKARR